MPNAVPSHRPSWMGHATSDQRYDAEVRDRESKRFYDSARWRKLRRLKLAEDPLCERCLGADRPVAATHVHHVIEIKDDPSLALDLANLESLCHSCHSRHHAKGA